MDDLDQRIHESPMFKTGLDRQLWAVEELRRKNGAIYYPELSNFRPKAVGERCTVHSHVWVGDDVALANDMKIQAFAFIPNGVVFEGGVFVGPRVTFCNDKVPPHNDFKPTLVKKGAAIGAGAVILPGITIGEWALIGAGSVVVHDVPDGEVWVGNPARLLKKSQTQALE